MIDGLGPTGIYDMRNNFYCRTKIGVTNPGRYGSIIQASWLWRYPLRGFSRIASSGEAA